MESGVTMNEECILLSVDSLPVVELPQYYKEGYFAKDSLLHPELQGGRYGVAGTPVPLSLRGDLSAALRGSKTARRAMRSSSCSVSTPSATSKC